MAQSFSAQMKVFENLTADKAEKVFRRTCLDLSSSIIKGTPVDSGRARMNWQPEINSFADGEIQAEDKSGLIAIGKVASTTTRLKVGSKFTLSNNLDYIEGLEYGNSKQAPQGMVRLNLLRFNQILQIANMEIK